MIKKQISCDDIYETGLLSVEQALKTILKSVHTLNDSQQRPIEQAVQCCLAENIYATFDVPSHKNSAVDGYAVLDDDIPKQGTLQLKVVGQAFAGKPYQGEIQAGDCLRIMTGAVLPSKMNTVIMQEHVDAKGDFIQIDANHHLGQNVRLAGEDLTQGACVLKVGKRLTPPDIGLLASLGLAEVSVKRKLRIAIASSGDEVFALGEQRSSSGLYDSNRYSLLAALTRPDIEVIDLGIIADDPYVLLATFQEVAKRVDLIISTGGVSVGDADYTKSALQATGTVDFWKIAIKPGRPLAFGHINQTAFFGLPGNPVAVMVTFYQFVIPAIEKMIGMTDKPIVPIFKVRALETIRKRAGRTEVQRGILEQDSTGEWTVKTAGRQGSGILYSMSLANAFILLEHEQATVNKGDYVNVQAFSGLF
ncbi:MAG: molybdopterin molybdotransferase MoeA [Methylococcales bacterium]|nr:molybdopterin molybdotransferase MoeA [Methylococcales bacterium]